MIEIGYIISRFLPPLATFGVLLLPDGTLAGALKLTCGRADVMNPRWSLPMTFAYPGGDAGPVTVTGPFEDFSIAVKRSFTSIQGEAGEALDGTAKVRVKLPTLADLEACIEQTSDPASKPDDNDAFLNARDACLQKRAPAPAGADVVEGLSIGLLADKGESSGEDGFVDLRLKYEGGKSGARRRDNGRASSSSMPFGKVTCPGEQVTSGSFAHNLTGFRLRLSTHQFNRTWSASCPSSQFYGHRSSALWSCHAWQSPPQRPLAIVRERRRICKWANLGIKHKM
ncbi:hypothetical protein [Mesorhizobium salmacidum]|uniref:Uncharacterized protein n=1 Tax=Mesorhizobium salmacidum TaxID=3015171 RepID=A0ABU8KUW4_9HYPH